MRRFLLAIFTVCLFLVGNLLSQKAHASHVAGGELTYAWVSGSTYQFTLKFYRDCSSGTTSLPTSLCYYSDCGSGNFSSALSTISGPTPIVTPCPGFNTTCNGGTLPGYQEYVLQTTITLPSQCSLWHFFTFVSARNSANNINGQPDFAIEATLNNLAAQGNSSPTFTVRPVPFVCANVQYTYNNGASDPNNDSLSFELIMGRIRTSCSDVFGSNVTYTSTVYNLTNNPFATGNSFFLSPTTGQSTFTPTTTGPWAFTLKVSEWRGGIIIGTVARDIQVYVRTCTSVPPVLSPVSNGSVGVNFGTTPISGCAGQLTSFCSRITSADTNAWLAVTSNNAAAAPGSTMTYSGIGTDTVLACFSWTPSLSDTGQKILTFSVSDTNCTSTGGIPITNTFSVPIYINPTTRASNDTTICYGASARLSVFGGSGFHWTVLPGGSDSTSLNTTYGNTVIASPTATTRYLVTSQGTSFCNGNHDTVIVTIAPIPTFNAGPDTTTCINNSLQLNAHVALPAGTYSIRWTPATYLSSDTVATPVVTPTNDISYVIRVTPGGAGACALFDTIRVNVVKGFDLLTQDTAICAGATVAIRTIGDTRYHYAWTPAKFVSDTTTANPLINPDTSRRYTVTATFPGCRDSVRSLFIDVQPIPTVFIGADRTLCYGDTVHMGMADVQPSAYPFYTYSWTPAGDFDDPTRLHPVFTGLRDTRLTLTATTPAGCSGTAGVNYTIIPANFLALSADTAICPGDTVSIRVTGGFYSLNWVNHAFISDTASANPRVWPITNTTYTVIGLDTNSCRDTASVLITVHPRALISLPDSVTIFPGESYAINPGGNCLYFTWFPPAGLSNANIANPIANPEVNTRYFVSARTEAGCSVSDSMDVNVSLDSWIDVPNAFSPGSQPNSILKIVHRGLVSVQKFRIFNRWGAQMFTTTDVNEGWDGSFNGTPQPMGVYVYFVEATTPTGRKFYKQGNITLLR